MKIAVDIASGEKKTAELIAGAIDAVQQRNIKVILVGNQKQIEQELKNFSYNNKDISIEHAEEIITMNEAPASACRKKPNASVMIASKLVGEGKAHGLFSPGNTGATLAASLMNIKRTKGVIRPGLGSILPNKKGHAFILDIGANIDCNEKHLVQFAIMGETFMKELIHEKPRVGILNIGEEEKKGNELTLKTFSILKSIDINFVGNVEGYDIFEGNVDVIVCDGFIGNVVLKVAEGIGSMFSNIVKNKMNKHNLKSTELLPFKNIFEEIKGKFNAADYGGAPLLGLNSCVIVGHGKSDSTACKNAIMLAEKMASINISNEIKINMQKLL